MKMSALDRVLLLATGLLAAYQVVIGIEGLSTLPIVAYTTGFGVLLIAGLLLIILGFEALDSAVVVIVSTLLPLSLALGLVWQYLPAWRAVYLAFAAIGFLAIGITRGIPGRGTLAVMALAGVHGIAGITITLLPFFLSYQRQVEAGFALVGVGGALIGVGGLLLSFLKAGRPILSRQAIFKTLPGLLLMMTMCFVVGFQYA